MTLAQKIENSFNFGKTRGRDGKFSTKSRKQSQITSAFNPYRQNSSGGATKELVSIGASRKTGKFSRSKVVTRTNNGKFSKPREVAVKMLKLGT